MNQNLMQSEKILSSLCYFSVFFAPFLLPIIVWIVADKPVSTHAKSSLLYHVYPYILGVLSVLLLAYANGSFESHLNNGLMITLNIIAIFIALLAFYYVIYNLYAGIKVLLK
ncbi:MAG: DUF4870 domain-containing protein [Mammaliicoccus vitulinus]